TSFMSPSDTLKASLNALTSSLVMMPSALAIFALRAITPTVKETSLSADRSRGSRSFSDARPNSVAVEAPTDDCATADASLSQLTTNPRPAPPPILVSQERAVRVSDPDNFPCPQFVDALVADTHSRFNTHRNI